jgi:hypothetical protein
MMSIAPPSARATLIDDRARRVDRLQHRRPVDLEIRQHDDFDWRIDVAFQICHRIDRRELHIAEVKRPFRAVRGEGRGAYEDE